MHQARTLIPIDSQSMARAFIISLDPLQEQELPYSDPQTINKPLKDTYMSKWIESLDEYLLKCWGVNKCTLLIKVPYSLLPSWQRASKPR